MPNLATLQSAVISALLAGRMQDVAGHFTANGKDPARRLNIYRNNTFISLAGALKTNFPVTMRMVDERFFAYAASAFIADHPPREPRLSTYGAKFPRFLAQFPPCRAYPVVAEMASFEWAIVKAMTAPEHDAAPVALLQRLSAIASSPKLALQPNLVFAISHWPVLEVWTAHRGEIAAGIPAFERRPTRVAIYRIGGRVRFLEIGAARFVFWRQLAAGAPLETALSRAFARDPMFDLVAELVLLFRTGLVTGIPTEPNYIN